LLLWVSDITRPETAVIDPALVARLPEKAPRLHVLNKIDISSTLPYQKASNDILKVAVSAKSGTGLGLLRSAILEAVGWGGDGEGLFMARERHLQALYETARHLDLGIERYGELDLFAEELKLAQNELGTITGQVSPDDLLGKIFANFCIGK
jgi:tRNA modification GTPase